nr:MAG TPA: hypothetical protein [Caudoviricetes sp.]
MAPLLCCIVLRIICNSSFCFIKSKNQKNNSNNYSCKYGSLCRNIKKK